MSRKVKAPEKEELIELYSREGTTISSLAKMYNTSQPTVRKWLIDYDIPRKDHRQASIEANANKGKRLTEAHEKLNDYDFCYNLYIEQKMSFREIGRYLGINEGIVRRYILLHKLDRDIKVINQQILDKACDLYQDGKTYQMISDILGISISKLSVLFNRSDINIRTANQYPRKINKISSYERQIHQLLQDNNIKYHVSDRTILNGKELDIILPDYKLAVEVNGLLYHSEQYGKHRNYHLDKTLRCKEKGYQLYHLFEDDLNNKFDIIQSMLLSKVGIVTKIMARKCKIVTLTKNEKKLFLNSNHIQGNDRSTFCFGLQYQDKIVACMSLLHYNNKWELSRFCNLINHSVIGGFSKLFNYSIMKLKIDQIISYSDNQWSSGNIYVSNNFEMLRVNKPSYSYYDGKTLKRIHRSNFKKSNFVNKYPLLELEGLTETQMADKVGLYRIWNCGTTTWIWNKKSGA